MPARLGLRLGLPLAAAAALPACSLPGTGGELVEVGWAFRADVPDDGPVVVETTGEDPWTVEIVEATLLVGPVYAFAPPSTPTALDLTALLRPGRARAHAGDDNTDGIRVLSELLDQVAVDLLDPTPRFLERTIAEAGRVDTMNVVLDEARFAMADPEGPTHGGHAYLRGVARRTLDGTAQVVRFAAVLGDTVPDDRIARRVESLSVDGSPLAEGAIVEVSDDPREWVRRMRFDDLVGVDGEGPDGEVRVSEPSQLHNAWYLGLRDPAGWSARVLATDEAQDLDR